MKLICDPFVRKPKKSGSIEYKRSYDIYTVGTFKEGEVKVRASFRPAGNDRDDPKLLFSVMWRPELDKTSQDDGGWFSGDVTLPLWFDRSSSCVLPKLEEITDGLPRQALVGRDAALSDVTLDEDNANVWNPHQVAPVANMEPEPMALDFTDIVNGNLSGGINALGQVRIKMQSPELPPLYLETRFELDQAFNTTFDANVRGSRDDPIVID